MPHFFIKNKEIKEDFIEISDKENYFHIVKVLRFKIGENIKLIDSNKIVYLSTIVEINNKSIKTKIISKRKTDKILKNKIHLIQSILASDAQNLAIANATQSGVQEIYPVISDNCSVSLKSLTNKLEKWQKIAIENFKQCERGDIPTIKNIMTLEDVIKNYKKENIIIFAERNENMSLQLSLNNIINDEPIAVIIGPEGGFSDREFTYFIENQYKLISLGKMIYKAPNAIVAGISNIVSRLENV